MVLVLTGLVAFVLAGAPPAYAAAPAYGAAVQADGAAQAEKVTVDITDAGTVTLTRTAAHLAVYWPGSPEAHVTLAFSSDGVDFGPPVDAGRDDAGLERHQGVTYGAVHAVDDAVALRITTDVPLRGLTVVALPAGAAAGTRLALAGSYLAGAGTSLAAAGEPDPFDPFDTFDVAQPEVIPRAAWGANPAYLSWAPRFYPATKVIVHHTSDNIVLDGTPEYYAKLVRAIYYYHAITQGWGDIAYNFLIDPLGNIYEGRYSDDDPLSSPGEDIHGNGVVGGHCANYNTGTVGIAVLGTYNSRSITAASRASLEQLLAWVVTRDGIDPLGSDPYFNPYDTSSTIKTWNIAGHLDYRSTDCPGAAFYKTLPSLRQTVSGLVGSVVAPTPSPTYLMLTKPDSSPVVGRQMTITATLKERSSQTPLPGQMVSFAIGGVATEAVLLGSALTDASGVATLQITCTTAQLQWLSAFFNPAVDVPADPAVQPVADPAVQPVSRLSYRGSTTSTELEVAPAAPVAVAGDAQVQLSWDPDVAAGGYNVYRNGKKVNSTAVASPAYVDTGLSNGVAYSYQTTVIANGRESAKSPAVSASPGTSGGGTTDGPAGDASEPVVDSPLFPDVLKGYPYYRAIQDLTCSGIINGAPGGQFLPGDSVTRQQFAKMIVLGGDYSVSEDDICPFKDVDRGGGATLYPDNYVAVCAVHGITQGKTAVTFDPYGTVTRAQVMTMVVRAAEDLKPSAILEPPAGWKGLLSTKDPAHGRNIARAEYSGLLAGIDLTAFSVSGKATRGEIAQIIWNLRAK